MYHLKSGVKQNPQRRWALPDRIFFAHGACHILAGTYLQAPPLPGFHAERIIPKNGLPGNHIFVTDGAIAFDYHGYSTCQGLLAHHIRACRGQYPTWDCDLETVAFDLLFTPDLNARKMLGPEQYLHDPIARARRFIQRIDHPCCAAKAADRHGLA